jgi:hypothetical protein
MVNWQFDLLLLLLDNLFSVYVQGGAPEHKQCHLKRNGCPMVTIREMCPFSIHWTYETWSTVIFYLWSTLLVCVLCVYVISEDVAIYGKMFVERTVNSG